MVGRAAVGLMLLGLMGGMALGAEGALPAEVRARVMDDGERPVVGARVAISRPGAKEGEAGVLGVTDGRGEVVLTVPMPGREGYLVQMEIQRPGEAAYKFNEYLFENAKKDQSFEMVGTRKTIVHVRGPGGEKIEGVPLEFQEVVTRVVPKSDRIVLKREFGWVNPASEAELRTGADGDLVWEHSPMAEGFVVTVGAGQEPLTGKKPLATKTSKDVDELTVTLAKGVVGKVFPTRVLKGTLLLPDGKPAKNWFVGGRVKRQTGSGSISGGGMTMMDHYTAERLTHPAADGTFEVRAPGEFLGLISPEGVQFLYSMDPERWDGGEHRVVLTVPSVAGVVPVRMVDEAGKAAVGVELRPTWMRSGVYWWQLSDDWAWGGGRAGNTEWKMVSDEQGVIQYPIYRGATPENLQIGRPVIEGAGAQSMGPLGIQTQLVVHGPGAAVAAAPAAAVRHVTLALVNAEGNAVTDFREMHVRDAGTQNDRGRTSNDDTAGLHYFVPRSVRGLDMEIPEGVYQAVRQSVALDDVDRQTVTIRLERGRAVRGRVVDAAGKPAAGIALSLYKIGVPANRGTMGMDVLDIVTTTDGEGRFTFAGAPEECFAFVEKTSERLKITAQSRTFEVRLPAWGSVRVLLPAGFGYAAFVPEGAGDGVRLELRLDRETNTLFRDELPPGRWHVAPETIPGLGDLSGMKVEVVGGRAAVLDLRGRVVEAAAGTGKMRRVGVAVEREGRAISGAEVAVFSSRTEIADLRGMIAAALRAKNTAERDAAVSRLFDVAGPAVELLDAEGEPGNAAEAELRGKLANGRDGLDLQANDLSDAGGLVHFEGRAGRVCWAVARVRGQWLGMKQFVIPEGDGVLPPVVVEMGALRPIVAPVPASNSNPPMTYGFTIVKPGGPEGRVLGRALTDDHLWGGGWAGRNAHANLALAVHPDGFTFDGLPPGTVISLQPPGVPGTRGDPPAVRVTIEEGVGPMRLKVE